MSIITKIMVTNKTARPLQNTRRILILGLDNMISDSDVNLDPDLRTIKVEDIYRQHKSFPYPALKYFNVLLLKFYLKFKK